MRVIQNRKLPFSLTSGVALLMVGVLGLGTLITFQQVRDNQKKSTSASATYDPVTKTFTEPFNGAPSSPQPYKQTGWYPNWDVAVHSRDLVNFKQLTPVNTHHGMDCSPPTDANGNLVTFRNDGNYDMAVFNCRDHMMTSIRAGLHGAFDEATSHPGEVDGYGLIELTPNQLLDLSSGGEATVQFDISTLRTSQRDWWDIWVTPYEDNLQLPLYDWLPDLQGEPYRAIHIQQGAFNGMTVFNGEEFNNFTATNLDGCWWCTLEDKMQTSPQKRNTFVLKLSKTHIKFYMPAGQTDINGNPINGGQEIVWVDRALPQPLDWNYGVVQLGHHSYNASKDCTADTTLKSCYPNTWHWDNFSMSPAVPFTIIHADKRYADSNATTTITFDRPAPANAFLRYSQTWGNTQLSFDNGATWKAPVKQKQEKDCQNGHACNIWMPIPQGTHSVVVKNTDGNYWWGSQGFAKDFAIWSLTTDSVTPTSGSSKIGDLNNDGAINVVDLSIFLTNYGPKNPIADVNKDGIVNVIDLSVLLTNFGK